MPFFFGNKIDQYCSWHDFSDNRFDEILDQWKCTNWEIIERKLKIENTQLNLKSVSTTTRKVKKCHWVKR